MLLYKHAGTNDRNKKVESKQRAECDHCRLCDAYKETVIHILYGCKVLEGSDYLKRHNNALMVLIVEWAKQESLLPSDSVWYKQKWRKGTVLEKNGKKI